MSSTVVWRGDQVVTAVEEAARIGIDEITSECVILSKDIVPRITAVLQGSIQMRPARINARQVVGEWGSYGVDYAIHVETIPAINSTGQRPYLRPVADQQYPKLPERIAAQYQRLTK